jgi:hypothetical protein
MGVHRKEARKLMLLGNRLAQRRVYDDKFLTEGGFTFMKMVWSVSGNRMDGKTMRFSRLQDTKRRYAQQFLKLGFLQLVTHPDCGDNLDRLVVTKLGEDQLYMRHKR